MAYAGLCVGGVTAPRPELIGVDDPGRRHHILREIAAEEARLVHGLGGNLIRLFYAVEAMVVPCDDDVAMVLAGSPSDAPYMARLEERLDRLDRCDSILDQLVVIMEGGVTTGHQLDLSALDAYVDGVEDFNRRLGAATPGVRLLLTMVNAPPRWVIEAPSEATLATHRRGYSFSSLWDRYLRVQASFHRLLVRRFIAARTATDRPAAVCAIEGTNEPDYLWIPHEMKIEGSTPLHVFPLWKYVTELYLSQVPETASSGAAFEVTQWGFCQDQDAEWAHARPASPTPIVEFDWGTKFDWYVKCFADLQETVASAVAGEAAANRVALDIVSGPVTHNNIDYLLRMFRANPRSFTSVTKIGIHPYHWVRNDVWDDRFVDTAPTDRWASASPREYARDYFKRFDFLREMAKYVRGGGAAARMWQRGRASRELSRALAGKKLWITEFGIGAKTLGAFNAPIAESTMFVRPRNEVGAAGGYDSAVWEDLWDAFLNQVDRDYLAANEVECLVLYALRESGIAAYDMDDDDRSNFALLRRSGEARMDPPTLTRLAGLLGAMAGGPNATKPASPMRSGVELHRRPWRSIEPPERVFEPICMLSKEERQMLYWLGAHYYHGAGAIVDGGCFLGGSTVALATGLQANAARTAGTTVDVYDRFEVEPYMLDLYLKDRGLKAGDSFLGVFEESTQSVNDLLTVHVGDLSAAAWDGRPIEILFCDIAKTWSLNDVIVREFFPCLIPDRSVVVQQDLVFSLCPWVAITMELLADYFEPVAFAEDNSLVYVCRKPVPTELEPPSPSQLPLETKLALIDRTINRFRGYPRGVLELAKAAILAEAGQLETARARADDVRRRFDADPVVVKAVAQFNSVVFGPLA